MKELWNKLIDSYFGKRIHSDFWSDKHFIRLGIRTVRLDVGTRYYYRTKAFNKYDIYHIVKASSTLDYQMLGFNEAVVWETRDLSALLKDLEFKLREHLYGVSSINEPCNK